MLWDKLANLTNCERKKFNLEKAENDENKPFSVEIKNTSYIKLESDGVDFFVRETQGIEKINP